MSSKPGRRNQCPPQTLGLGEARRRRRLLPSSQEVSEQPTSPTLSAPYQARSSWRCQTRRRGPRSMTWARLQERPKAPMGLRSPRPEVAPARHFPFGVEATHSLQHVGGGLVVSDHVALAAGRTIPIGSANAAAPPSAFGCNRCGVSASNQSGHIAPVHLQTTALDLTPGSPAQLAHVLFGPSLERRSYSWAPPPIWGDRTSWRMNIASRTGSYFFKCSASCEICC